MYAPDFVFTSPQDDPIDLAAFFERCFPTAARLREQEILQLVPTDGPGVLVMYEYELVDGARHRNTGRSTSSSAGGATGPTEPKAE